MQAAADALAAGTPGADDTYSRGLERWLALGGADLDERADAVVTGLGLTVELDQAMTTLSGGQAARASLASLLLSRYDVFLLDEPTNDLDLDGLARLEAFVQDLRAGAVIVSHDREFLTRTVTRVVELDLAQQQVRAYGGGYAAYLDEREVARRHARADYEEYADTRASRRNGPAPSGPGWKRASRTPGASSRTTTRWAGSSAPRRPRSRRRRPARPSG